jgi:hypothetical protein
MHPSPSVSAALNASLVLSEDMYWRFIAQEQSHRSGTYSVNTCRERKPPLKI